MSEVEKMYKLANIAKPVIKKWYYDGYYEDFSWESSEEDCTELLKYFDNSIDKLNDRIQQMKKEENTKYDRYTDSVDTEFGRIEKAYINYPSFTAKKQLHLIKWLSDKADYVDIHYDRYKGLFNIQTGMGGLYVCNEFEQALASRVNIIWQDLTEEERKQVRGILE